MKTAEEYRREMESYFGAATEDKEGEIRGPSGPVAQPGRASASQVRDAGSNPDRSTSKSLRLHDYRRQPKKAVIAQGLFKQQKGLCAEGAVCEGFLEIDHVNGDPDNWAWGNLELLCETHHRAKTNRDRARRSRGVYVKKPGVSFDGAGLSPKSVSLENDKHENYVARFDKAAPAYFLERMHEAESYHGGEANPVVSIRSFRRAMIGALTYTDEAGRTHKPSQVTLDRYIDADIYPDNPSGRFEYAQTSGNEDGIRWVGKKPTSVQEGIQA